MNTRQLTEDIFDFLQDRGGFDGWWGDIDSETQDEIMQGVRKLIDDGISKDVAP